MARMRKAEAGAINIRLHPHYGEEHYISLMRDAFKIRQSFYSRGDQMLLMSFLDRPTEIEGKICISGTIARFTNIESDQSWFNLKTNDEAEETDVRQIKIPDYLKPNYKPFAFIFFPKKHKLVFEKYSDGSSISHGVVGSFLGKLFSNESIREKYGEINLDIVSDQKGLEAIFTIPILKHLEITIQRPNPDDHDAEELEILERMNAQRVNRIEQRLTAISGQSISPDTDTKILAKVALENGKVYGDGTDLNGKKIDYSTRKFPRTERYRYDPDTMTASNAFNKIAQRYVQ